MNRFTLLCAATSIEANACRRGILNAKAERYFDVLKTGVGKKAARALREYLKDRRSVGLIVSTGFAGSRLSAISCGDWVLGTRVSNEERAELSLENSLAEVLQRTDLKWTQADYRSLAHVALAEAEIEASLVDMESYGLALVAREAQVPFQILRVVSDTRQEPLPRSLGLLASNRLAHKLTGMVQALQHPRELASFVLRARNLPDRLAQGWEKLAGVPGPWKTV